MAYQFHHSAKPLLGFDSTSEDNSDSSGLPRYFCREQFRSQKRRRQQQGPGNPETRKRKETDDDTENGLTKRAKLSSDELMDESTSVNKVLDMISSSDLKAIVRKLLADSVAGPVLTKELLASSETSLEYAREEAEKLCDDIIQKSSDAIQDVLDEADEMDGMQSGDAWPSALAEFLPNIRNLADRGPLVDGPELAWDALLHVAEECRLPTSGETRLETGEEDCDEFHKKVDELMLYICKLQEANGQTDWLRDIERKSQIWILQETAAAPVDFKGDDWCIYRYQETLKFLQDFGTE